MTQKFIEQPAHPRGTKHPPPVSPLATPISSRRISLTPAPAPAPTSGPGDTYAKSGARCQSTPRPERQVILRPADLQTFGRRVGSTALAPPAVRLFFQRSDETSPPWEWYRYSTLLGVSVAY